MKVAQFKICAGGQCESYIALARDIEDKLGLKNVRVEPETRELFYDNPQNCRVDERLLEEAAASPGRILNFERCD